MSSRGDESVLKTKRRHVADMMYEAASRAAASKSVESLDSLPALSLYSFVMSLLALGRRVSKIGRIELGIAEIMSWERPAMTLTFLFGYTILCYHPQWLVLLPSFYFVFGVLVPNYAEKFKLGPWDDIAAKDSETDLILDSTELSGSEKKDEEKQREARNLVVAIRSGQQMLANIVTALDKFDEFRNGPARFDDPQLSIMMLVVAASVLFSGAYALTFVSIPFFFAFLGWSAVCAKHPLAKVTSEKLEDLHIEPQLDVKKLFASFKEFCRTNIKVDEEPLCREVEIFELQRRGLTMRQWDSTHIVYSKDPYFKCSETRTNKQLPNGTPELSDVLPPDGWYFDLRDDWLPDEDPKVWLGNSSFEDALYRDKVIVDGQWVYDSSNYDENSDPLMEPTKWRRRLLKRKCYYDFS